MMHSDVRSIQSQFHNLLEKASEPSIILTTSSKRFSYAIQSIPHQIKQTKTAFRDYFNYDDNDQVSQEEVSHKPSISNLNTSTQFPKNPYAIADKAKKMLPIKLKNMLNQRLFQCFKTINEKKMATSITARKLPTFRANSQIKVNEEESHIEIRQSLIGSITKLFVHF